MNIAIRLLIIILLICGSTTASLAQQITRKRGTVKFRYANRQLSARGKVKNYQKQGPWKFWDDKGNLFSVAVYLNDTANGKYIEYSPGGMIAVQGTFCMNLKCGNWKSYDANGKQISDENFAEGQMHGVQQFWYPNGQLREYLTADQGQLQSRKAWYPDGHVKAIESYRNNLPHGKWFAYPDPSMVKDTFPSSVIEFKDGLRHGSYRTYSGSQLIEDYRYNEGKADGVQLKWEADGKPAIIEYYTGGNLDSGTYYIHGIVARTAHYKNERKHGPEVDFDRNGDTLKLTWWNSGLTDSSFTYHKNGRRSSALYYDNFLNEARYIEWDNAGLKIQSGLYVDGQRNGEWFTWYPDGKKRSLTHYQYGQMTGLYTKWYPNGKTMIAMTFLPVGGVNTQPDVWNEKGKPIKMGTKEYDEIVEGNKPGEIFSDASQYNRPIINKRVEENRLDDESEILEIGYPTTELPPGWEPPAEEMVDTNEVYSYCEFMPEFPGGTVAQTKFIADNLKYPEKDAEGRVYIEYIVERDGRVTNVKVLKGIPGTPEFDQAAVDVVSKFPAHSPARHNGVPVRCRVVIPIRFEF